MNSDASTLLGNASVCEFGPQYHRTPSPPDYFLWGHTK